MAHATYIKLFSTTHEAVDCMVRMNRAHPHAEPVVLIDGPDEDYAVVNLSTAIEMEALYRWEA